MNSDIPKVLHEVAGRSLVGWVCHALDGVDLAATVVVTQPDADDIRAAVPASAIIAEQAEQLGTAHATGVGLSALTVESDDIVLVLPGDTPLLTPESLSQLVATHREHGAVATCLTADVADATGYGRVVRGEDGLVARVVEHKDASESELAISEINGGIYAFDAVELAAALKLVTADNAQGEYYLPDVIGGFTRAGKSVAAVKISEDELAGVNSQDQLAAAAKQRRAEINTRLMRSGVWMQDPDRVYVDASAAVEPGAKLYADVHLLGETTIGAGSSIGPDVYLRDTDVGAGVTIWYAVIREASVGDEAEIGPYVSLRPGSTLLHGAKAGTFVELKNAVLREGAKANHLAYLGDADVGEKANIGAGTITVNYDGFTKSRTIVGKGARIGSDTMLVAPVEIGEGAFTGAGSVITKDVSPGALAVERSAQKEVPGYAARKHERHERKKKAD